MSRLNRPIRLLVALAVLALVMLAASSISSAKPQGTWVESQYQDCASGELCACWEVQGSAPVLCCVESLDFYSNKHDFSICASLRIHQHE